MKSKTEPKVKDARVSFMQGIAKINPNRKYIFLCQSNQWPENMINELRVRLQKMGLKDEDFIIVPYPLEIWEVKPGNGK